MPWVRRHSDWTPRRDVSKTRDPARSNSGRDQTYSVRYRWDACTYRRCRRPRHGARIRRRLRIAAWDGFNLDGGPYRRLDCGADGGESWPRLHARFAYAVSRRLHRTFAEGDSQAWAAKRHPARRARRAR